MPECFRTSYCRVGPVLLLQVVATMAWATMAWTTLAWTTLAWAAPDEAMRRARQLYERAEQSYSVGQFAEAAEYYEQAHRAKPLPGFLFNLGQCHRQLGQFRKARFFFRLYLERKPDSSRRATVDSLIRDCDEQLRQQAQAEQTSAPVPVPGPASQPAGGPTTLPGASGPHRSSSGHESDGSRRRQILLWSGVGLSSALLVTAATTWAIALDKASRYRDADTPLDEQQRLKSSGEALVATAGITLGLGLAVAAGTGLYYWLSGRSAGGRLDVAAAPQAGGGLVLLRGDL